MLAIWLPLLALGVSAAFAVRSTAGRFADARAEQSAELALSMEHQRFVSFFAGRQAVLRAWMHTAEVQSLDPARTRAFLDAEEPDFAALFEHLYFADVEGRVVPTQSPPFSIRDRPFFPRLAGGQDIISQVITSRDTGARIVVIGVPVRDAGGQVRGALIGTVRVDALFGDLGHTSVTNPRGLEVVVVQRSDGAQYGATGWAERLQATPLTSEGLFALAGDGPPVHGWARPLAINDWVVVVLRPADDLYATSRRLQDIIIGLLGVTLAFGFFFSRWISRRLTHPMVALLDAQRRFGEGDRAVRVVDPGHDELGALGAGFNAMAQQLTEGDAQRRALELRLAQSQRLESLGRLAGGVAHDFNNFLTIIINLSEVVAMDLGPAHPSSKDLQTIIGAGQQSAQLTRQLLAFARRQASEPKVFALDAQLAEWQPMLKRLLPENVSFTLQLGAGPAHVRVDPTQLMQVVVNLAVNARDAMPDGGALTLGTSADAQTVRLSITDTGGGLSEEARAHLFEPFFTTKQQGRGTGLGLATCYGIATQSGGDITADAPAAGGTRFTLSLPVVPPRDTATPVPALPARYAPRRLLVVEDDAGVRSTLTSLLTRAGHSVSAVAAAQARAAPEFDVLITDVVMPGEDGASLAQALLEARPKVGVVLLSGYAPVLPDALLKSPRVVFLMKPPSAGALEAAVAKVSAASSGA